MKICPVPTEPIPILVGGHADRALRRAATLGDGWVHGGGDPAELPALLDRVAELRREAGRDDEPFEIHVISMDAYTVDGVRRLEDLGVTDVSSASATRTCARPTPSRSRTSSTPCAGSART